MQSIAIPDSRAPLEYRSVISTIDTGKLISHLSGGKVKGRHRVHLDPDIDARQLPRKSNWRALFGQCGAAQSHLVSQGVGPGDIFLFFGWFRQVEYLKRRWRYVTSAPDRHVIFGWLQVNTIHDIAVINTRSRSSRLQYHPHFHGDFSGQNTLYEAGRRLDIDGLQAFTGGGVFRQYQSQRCLTAAGYSRSIWQLPEWMHPTGRNSVLSYHSDPKRWQSLDGKVQLRSAARGQEFVLDLNDYPEGYQWMRELFGADSG